MRKCLLSIGALMVSLSVRAQTHAKATSSTGVDTKKSVPAADFAEDVKPIHASSSKRLV
jgi:hypothetical protein